MEQITIPDGYWEDARGCLIPEEQIKFNRGLLYYHPALYKHIHIDKKDFPLSLERYTAVANI